MTVTTTKQKTKSKEQFVEFLCGCHSMIPPINTKGKPVKYKQYHYNNSYSPLSVQRREILKMELLDKQNRQKQQQLLRLKVEEETDRRRKFQHYYYMGYLQEDLSDIDEINGVLYSFCHVCNKGYEQNLSDFNEDYYLDFECPKEVNENGVISLGVCKSCYLKAMLEKEEKT